jgi:hypothetical protein
MFTVAMLGALAPDVADTACVRAYDFCCISETCLNDLFIFPVCNHNLFSHV